MKLRNLLVVGVMMGMAFTTYGNNEAEKALDVRTPVLSSSALKSKYTLISFWSGSDVSSRVGVAKLEKSVSGLGSDKISIIAVAFDPMKLMYDKYGVGNDGIYSDVYETYKLRKSLSNYLVDEKGNVVARDLTTETLAFYVK